MLRASPSCPVRGGSRRPPPWSSPRPRHTAPRSCSAPTPCCRHTLGCRHQSSSRSAAPTENMVLFCYTINYTGWCAHLPRLLVVPGPVSAARPLPAQRAALRPAAHPQPPLLPLPVLGVVVVVRAGQGESCEYQGLLNISNE